MSLDFAQPERLARMLQLSQTGDPVLQTDDLGAMLRHQLRVPLVYDNGGASPVPGNGKADTAGPAGASSGVGCLGELLKAAHPPLHLLTLLKDFAKASARGPEPQVAPEVALVLYYAAIVAARLRCQTRITSLSDQQLAEGLAWALSRDWLDDVTRGLLEEARGPRPPSRERTGAAA